MANEHRDLLRVLCIQDSGTTVRCMARVYSHGLMGVFMTVITEMVKDMVKVFSHGLMGGVLKVN